MMELIEQLFTIALIALNPGQCVTHDLTWPQLALYREDGGYAPSVGVILLETFPEGHQFEGQWHSPNYWWELLPQGVEMKHPRAIDNGVLRLEFCHSGPGKSGATTLNLFAHSWQRDYNGRPDIDGSEPEPMPDPFPSPHPFTPGPGQTPVPGAMLSTAITNCARKWPNKDRTYVRSTLQQVSPKAPYKAAVQRALCP
jgi:hypothetical protein